MVERKRIIEILEKIAPLSLAESWDNSGLLVDANKEISNILICLDVNHAMINEAVSKNCNLIISHHPPIFEPIKDLKSEDIAFKAIKHNISLYAMHTNMDKADDGLNDILAQMIGLKNIHKISNEMDADDVFSNDTLDFVRVGTLDESTDVMKYARFVCSALDMNGLRISGDLKKQVKTVAVACGAGGDMMFDAEKQEADVFITGEMKHHLYLEATKRKMVIFEAGHYHTEKHFVNIIHSRLQSALNQLKSNVNVFKSEIEDSPYEVVFSDQ